MKKGLFSKILPLLILSVIALALLTACAGVNFEVDFVADGEVIHTVTTTGKEVIKLPDNPTKEGYEFKGWYWDENVWQKPFTANSFLDEPLTGDMKVYAKFEKSGSSAIETLPIEGTAYRLFLDQENAGFRCYLSGVADGYNLGTTINAEDAVNVYVEESDISDKYAIFCVKDGKRLYINIENNGTIYHPVLSNVASTFYEYDLNLKTFIGMVDGNSLVFATNAGGNFRRIDVRYLNESNFLTHLCISDTPDDEIPEVEAFESSILDVINGDIGLYKVEATVIGVNAQSFLIEDESGRILVYRGSSWTPDVEVGNIVTVEGKSSIYAGFKQFTVDSTYKVTGSTSALEQPSPKMLTVADLESYANNGISAIDYVKLGGVLTISGPYINIKVDGTTVMGAYSYPIDDLSAYAGKYVEIVGYVTSITGSSVRYVNILATDINEATAPDTPVNPDTPDTPSAIETNIAGVITGETGLYKTSGTVIAVNAQSFLIKDSSGAILVYKGSGWAQDLKIGDVVSVEGESSIYYNMKQFGKDAVYSVTGSEEVTHPTPTEISSTKLNEYATLTDYSVEYVKLTGELNVSGNYYNIVVGDATIKGSIAYPAENLSALNGKTVDVVGYFIYVSGSSQKYFNVIATSVTEVASDIPATPDTPSTDEVSIADIIAGELGSYKTSGTVIAVNAQSFLIKDSSGAILVYKGSGWAQDLKIGDVVSIEGESSIYYNMKQFGKDTVYSVTGSEEVTHPTPTEISSTKLDEYATLTDYSVEYVKLTGELNVSGNYYNIIVGDATIKGSIAYPTENLSALNGKTVDVVGYFIYVSGSSQKYFNIIATSVTESTPDTPVNPDTPDTPTAIETNIAGVIAGETGLYKTSGTVIAVNAQSFLIKDSSGAILVYKGSGWAQDLKIGDVVSIEGESSIYYNMKQFGKDTVYSVTGSEEVTHPTPTEISSTKLDEYATLTDYSVEYVKLTGELNVSGNYYNIIVGDATIKGSIAYPAENLSALNGKTVDVVGYFIYVSGSTQKYFNVIATSVTEVLS